MIAANPGLSPTTGWPVGFWWAEPTHPYRTFTEAGHAVDIVSPAGGDLVADGCSDPQDPSGHSADDLISLGFKLSPRHAALLQGTRPRASVDPGDDDAIFVAVRLTPFAVRDGNPITGQPQHSGAAADLVVQALGR